ncbi:MAG: B12-binding domain-containing radical SAM protein, partial [Rhodospirillaceae bacterium]
SGWFRAGTEKPDVTQTPIPRYDLLNFDDYTTMSVQYSRGCPFMCEFCDIITLYGRRPRTKTPEQVVAELQTLYDLGWRRHIFMVDDNFIGNLRTVRTLVDHIADWQKPRSYPFTISTEASINIADHPDLMRAMRLAHFNAIFIGIETPDVDSLLLTKKAQNTRQPLVESLQAINQAGLRIHAGFIIGFDGEKPGADERILALAEEAAIPQVIVNMLHAMPQTPLSHRLRREGRLIERDEIKDCNDNSLTNFVPTRPIQELAEEHINVTEKLYAIDQFILRCYRNCIDLRLAVPGKGEVRRKVGARELRGLATVIWRNGIVRGSRGVFWRCFLKLLRKNKPAAVPFLMYMLNLEHLSWFQEISRDEIKNQLAALPDEERQRFYTPTPQTDPTPLAAPAAE